MVALGAQACAAVGEDRVQAVAQQFGGDELFQGRRRQLGLQRVAAQLSYESGGRADPADAQAAPEDLAGGADLHDAGPGQVRTVTTGTDFLRPAWDFSDRMWLVDRNGGSARVFQVDPEGERVAPVRVPGLTGERVRMFLVSRDSTRLVAVVRRDKEDLLLVSRIEHNAAGDGLLLLLRSSAHRRLPTTTPSRAVPAIPSSDRR